MDELDDVSHERSGNILDIILLHPSISSRFLKPNSNLDDENAARSCGKVCPVMICDALSHINGHGRLHYIHVYETYAIKLEFCNLSQLLPCL